MCSFASPVLTDKMPGCHKSLSPAALLLQGLHRLCAAVRGPAHQAADGHQVHSEGPGLRRRRRAQRARQPAPVPRPPPHRATAGGVLVFATCVGDSLVYAEMGVCLLMRRRSLHTQPRLDLQCLGSCRLFRGRCRFSRGTHCTKNFQTAIWSCSSALLLCHLHYCCAT